MYLCSKGCGKRFAYSDNRNAHEKHCAEGGIGDSDKIHICFCGSAYSRKSKLKVSPNNACFRLSKLNLRSSNFSFQEHLEKSHGTMEPHAHIENELDDNDVRGRSLGDSV